ncbi:MAG: protein kinase [Muribaculaceae bacterium]|nr:protein kinase [Muribaculaceae bacterium]
MLRVISTNSGEATIFQIENGGNNFALKLYRLGIHPNHEVLERVMNLRGNGMLIDIYAHGVWKDDKTGQTHDYEIMEYCSGGSMASLQLTGDEKQMKEIAARMAATLDFAHSHAILHRDVKPANFLYRDDSHTQFVLTDWGLAKILDKNGQTVTDNGKTKIYAAPELYIFYTDKPTYVGPKADFFSMGMTLLALWMGEGRLIADERKLVEDKLEEELPYPSKNEMSEHLLSLIKALTRRNPTNRAGLDEIVKWSKGEIIYKDTAVDDSLAEFKIVFSATDNLIAHNAKELGEIMWANKELAKSYLYKGDEIYTWLMNVDRPELARQIDDFVELDYPGNEDAGLFAACLLLNPDMKFEGLDGNLIKTQQDVARELYEHTQEYKKALGKKDYPMWIYLSAKGLKNRIKDFQKAIRKNGVSGVREIAYTLDPALPFIFPATIRSGASYFELDTLEEMAEAFAEGKVYADEYLDKNDFLLWLAHRNPALAGKAKGIADDKSCPSYDKYGLILYTILPKVGYDYKPIAESDSATPEQIGRMIMSDIVDNPVSLWGFSVSNLRRYFLARGIYSKQISWIEYCMDITSEDNMKKGGPYNAKIGTMKGASGLAGEVLPLEIGGMTLKNPQDVTSASQAIARLDTDKQTLIADWLTLFFQEELNADYKKESYFKRLSRYYDFLARYVPGSEYVKKAKPKSDAIRAAKAEFEAAKKKCKVVTWLAILLGIIPLTLAIGAGVYTVLKFGAADIGDVMETVGWWVGLAVGILVGFALMGETENLIIGGIGGFITFALIKAGVVFITPAVPWIILGFFFVMLIMFARGIWNNQPFSSIYTRSELPLDEGIERTIMGEAFDSRKKLLPDNLLSQGNSAWPGTEYPIGVIKRNVTYAKNDFSELVKKTIWLVLLAVGASAFCIWTYRMTVNTDFALLRAKPAGIELLDGHFSGDVKGTPLTIDFSTSGSKMKADMDIKYRSGATVQTMETKNVKAFPVVLQKTDNDKITLTIDTAYVESEATIIKGSYLNSKGNRQPVNVKKE